MVLSGTGSDGTLGLRAIKEKAGATFVQSLDSAKFDGMPRSAIDARLADVIAPVEELPGRIIAYLKHPPYIKAPKSGLEGEAKQESALEKILVLLRAQSGNDFSLYKRSTVERRIERRMGLHQIDRMENYVRYLRENPREVELLFSELLIGVTSFFRDPDAWEGLRKEALPELVRARSHEKVLRAWVPGCSTGEEAYSLAIVLTEAIENAKPATNLSVQIFAAKQAHSALPLQPQSRGFLFLGSAETVGASSNLFSAVTPGARLYRRLDTPLGAPPVEFPSSLIVHETAGYEREGDTIKAINT